MKRGRRRTSVWKRGGGRRGEVLTNRLDVDASTEKTLSIKEFSNPLVSTFEWKNHSMISRKLLSCKRKEKIE
jgi:hypothetical protein